jgi:hypothetical protein
MGELAHVFGDFGDREITGDQGGLVTGGLRKHLKCGSTDGATEVERLIDLHEQNMGAECL